MIKQNQKSFSYFMDRTKHNMNFSKANDETTQMQSTNLQHSISNPILSCVRTYAVFPSKEHESKVPEPLVLIYTAPPCN